MDDRELIDRAVAARSRAWAPYSHLTVGAALRASDGRVFTGCNVENASYGLTMCAERSAVYAAVSDGARGFDAIVVASEDGLTPCGACRQVLAEFAPDLAVTVVAGAGEVRARTSLELLLPCPPDVPKAPASPADPPAG